MTIGKGQEWGADAPLADDGVVCGSDDELRTHVEMCRRRGTELAPAGITGGDMWATLGSPLGGESRLRGPQARTVPIDIASVLLDGRQYWFASHLVARRSWWRGRVMVALNAEWLGDWDLGKRAHPNDGFLDIYDTTMTLAERLKARGRLRLGTHFPHPDITYRRVKAHQTTFDPPLDVWLDGAKIGRISNLTLRVEPDAIQLTV